VERSIALVVLEEAFTLADESADKTIAVEG
jgi:hypothetical protein